jgi:probable F420-dependent oxidoreductase
MEFGIGLPTAGPDASPDRLARAAEEAERLGLGAVWTFERLLYPEEPMMLGVGPIPLPPANVGVWDPLEVLAFAAARTSRIRLGTSVLNTLFHDPVVLAKRLATVDRLSGGRLLAGLGLGWMEQEFAATGVDTAGRGAAMEAHLATMRAIWGDDPVRIGGVEAQVGPKPVRPGGPALLLGAAAPAGIARAARLGLGLTQVLFDWDMLAAVVGQFRDAAAEAGHDPAALPVVVQVNGVVGEEVPQAQRMPLTGSPEQVAGELGRLRELGVAHVFWTQPDQDAGPQLEGIARLQKLL